MNLMTPFELIAGLAALAIILVFILISLISLAYARGVTSVTEQPAPPDDLPEKFADAEVEVPIEVAEVVGYLSPLTGPIAVIPATPHESYDSLTPQAVLKQLRNDQ